MNNLYTYVGISLLIVYFAIFYWVFKTAGTETSEKYKRTFSGQVKFNILTGLLLLAAFWVSDLLLAACLFLAAIVGVIWATMHQHKRMKLVGFNSAFSSRLLRTSFLSIVAISCIFAGKISGILDAT